MDLQKALAVGGFAIGWINRASRDGQITAEEGIDLLHGLIEAAGYRDLVRVIWTAKEVIRTEGKPGAAAGDRKSSPILTDDQY